ncbi:hypothetical protein ACPA9J_05480 [Pseudomonas aeruginosa]
MPQALSTDISRWRRYRRFLAERPLGRAGYANVLVESAASAAGQSVKSQGII